MLDLLGKFPEPDDHYEVIYEVGASTTYEVGASSMRWRVFYEVGASSMILNRRSIDEVGDLPPHR